MTFIADLHCHTIASDHAYSTVFELAAHAKKRGIEIIAITDHSMALSDAPDLMHFKKMDVLPKYIEDVRVLSGVEANIMNYEGVTDMPFGVLKKLDWVIASMHEQVVKPGSLDDHTRGWIAIAKDENIDCIGHCGDERFRFDYEKVVKTFKEYNKVVEVNNHSYVARQNALVNCSEIAKLCKKYEVPVIVTSDAHFCYAVGSFGDAVRMLEDIDFPKDLVLNSDRDLLYDSIKQLRGKDLRA